MSGTLPPRVIDAATATNKRFVSVTHAGPEPLQVLGFVEAVVASGDGRDDITLDGIKRGKVTTGLGGDVVKVKATSTSGGAGNLFDIDTGAGHDRVEFVGQRGMTEALINLGEGTDVVLIQGARVATINGGLGTDFVEFVAGIDGRYTYNGGENFDVVTLNTLNRADVQVVRTGEGAATLTPLAAMSMWAWQRPFLQLVDVERVRFADGTRLDLRTTAEPARPTEGNPAGNAVILTSTRAELGTGSYQNDFLQGSRGDTLAGGEGDDTYMYNHFATYVERPGEGVDLVRSFLNNSFVLPDNFENGRVETGDLPFYGEHIKNIGGAGAPGVTGNALNNWLEGSGGRNRLDGLGGDDVLTGGGGTDTFVFGLRYGHDLVRDFQAAGAGADRVRLVSGWDTWEEVAANLADTAQGARLTLADGGTLTFQGVARAQLGASHFEFPLDRSKYVLTFADEFNDRFSEFNGKGESLGGGADGGTWRPRFHHSEGRWNASTDVQRYLKPGEVEGLETIRIVDGALRLSAYYRPDLAPAPTTADPVYRPFVSGMATTEGTFAQKHGLWEARMRSEAGAEKALHSTFWLLPTVGSKNPLELDIMEQISRDPNTVYLMGYLETLDTTQWHTYGLEWTEDRLAWYVDDRLVHTTYTHDATVASYIVFNLSMGGGFAGTPGAFAPGALVGSMEVDWVRVWQHEDELAAVAPVTRPDNAPRVTFAGGAPVPSGDYQNWLRFDYTADASGDILFPYPRDIGLDYLADFWDGSPGRDQWMGLYVLNDRATDFYRATVADGRKGLNIRVVDDDGGTFEVDAFVHAGLVLGGTQDDVVRLTRVQSADISTGAGNDTITIASPGIWNHGAARAFNVSAGAGNDSVSVTSFTRDHQFNFSGGAGNDTLAGSARTDTLMGGSGDDVLTGGFSRDIFVFNGWEGGADRITDFNRNEDVLRFNQVQSSAVSVSATAEGTLVSWAGVPLWGWDPGSVLLVGVAATYAQLAPRFEFIA